MPTMVDFPTIGKDAVDIFGDLLANEPERRHFCRIPDRADGCRKEDCQRDQQCVCGDNRPLMLAPLAP